MEKSQLGMLRSLLHELLLTDKAMVPVAFPLWTENHDVVEPDFPEVAAAFSRTLAADKRKICFFIDGLDEYEGDSIRIAELARYLEQLARSSMNVKFVVSSRPLHELQDHIQAWPHLMLQDLTSGDILTFVKTSYAKTSICCDLRNENPPPQLSFLTSLSRERLGSFSGFTSWFGPSSKV